MFIDRVRIFVTAGAGGNGCCSFRREKYVPRGGPDGGDGGRGGDVFLVATTQLSTLLDLRYHPHQKAERGLHGQGSNKHGKAGEPLEIRVPVGTVVYDDETGALVADLDMAGARVRLAEGGRGGKGNPRFATSTNRAPKFCENGEPGEERTYRLELKLIADVGIVGLPNAGKSTLLSVTSAAKPKIGDYPFTTISPNLGVVGLPDHRSLTIADIPGLIEGAAEGKGLGHDFLRHIERTKVLLYLIDPSDSPAEDTLETLQRELYAHSEKFRTRPALIALSKADIPANREAYASFVQRHPGALLVSSVTGDGLAELLEALWDAVQHADEPPMEQPDAPDAGYNYEPPFVIERVDTGFDVRGKKVVRAVRMTDFSNEEAVRHLDKRLRKMGLYHELQRLGAAEGESIHIGGVELEYRAD